MVFPSIRDEVGSRIEGNRRSTEFTEFREIRLNLWVCYAGVDGPRWTCDDPVLFIISSRMTIVVGTKITLHSSVDTRESRLTI